MRCLEVSCMKSDATMIGAAINIMTHMENRQLSWYSAMMYAPVRGPNEGPRNGARMKNKAARPLD